MAAKKYQDDFLAISVKNLYKKIDCQELIQNAEYNLISDIRACSKNEMKWNELNRALGHLCAHIG